MLALIPASAGATFHLMKIHRGGPGDPGAPGTAFIELQMYARGQNFVGGQDDPDLYDAAGTVQDTFTFPSDVANGGTQRTILWRGTMALRRDA